MTEIRARAAAVPNHRIFGTASTPAPLGEHEVIITVPLSPKRRAPGGRFDADALPTHDMRPWPERLGLRREDIYGKDGWWLIAAESKSEE